MRQMRRLSVHASSTANQPELRAVRAIVLAAAAAAFLAFLGALGTDQASFVVRLGYWLAVFIPGALLGIAATVLVRMWGRLPARSWREILAVTLLISLPHSFIVIVMSGLFYGSLTISVVVIFQFWVAVFLTTLVMTAINTLVSSSSSPEMLTIPNAEAELVVVEEVKVDQPPVSPPTPPICGPQLPAIPQLIEQKLPAQLRGAGLLAIEAENHYLRVHTAAGSDLVLMRMLDACDLLANAPGARVHRSWWVARTSVVASQSRGGRLFLTLPSGLEAPVNRAMQNEIRSKGWLT